MKASFTRSNFYGTICMTRNWLLDFHCVYTFIKVVSTEFIHVVCIEYSVFKSLSKLSQEQAAVNIAITSDKNRQRKTRKKKKDQYETGALKREKRWIL